MTEDNNTVAHDKHDHERWLAEIEKCKQEHSRALEVLEQAANFVRMHDSEVLEHEKAVREHEQMLSKGETTTPSGEDVSALHEQFTIRHNRYKGRHKGVIEEIMRLAVTLHKASHQPAP